MNRRPGRPPAGPGAREEQDVSYLEFVKMVSGGYPVAEASGACNVLRVRIEPER